MFGHYFERWLIDNGIISQAGIEGIDDLTYPAFLHKLTENGVMSGDDAGRSLAAFKNEYGLSEESLDTLSCGDIERIIPIFINFDATEMIDGYLSAYQLDNGLTDEELEARRDPEQLRRILPSYLLSDTKHYNRFVHLAVDAVARMISKNIVLKKMKVAHEHYFKRFAYQELKGTHHMFFGFAGKGNSLLVIADKFAGRKFENMDSEAYDSVCEFINTINGLYASEMSYENVKLEITLPTVCSDKALRSGSNIYCLPIVLDGAEIEMIFSFDSKIHIS